MAQKLNEGRLDGSRQSSDEASSAANASHYRAAKPEGAGGAAGGPDAAHAVGAHDGHRAQQPEELTGARISEPGEVAAGVPGALAAMK